jgi:hypothetical protein
VPRGYKKDKEDRQSVEFRDASLPGYELGSTGIEATELLSAVQWSLKVWLRTENFMSAIVPR